MNIIFKVADLHFVVQHAMSNKGVAGTMVSELCEREHVNLEENMDYDDLGHKVHKSHQSPNYKEHHSQLAVQLLTLTLDLLSDIFFSCDGSIGLSLLLLQFLNSVN